jgi:DNA-binding response OmpR family regulator
MIRVLVIDDDPGIRLVLRKSLEFSGYEVVTAADGESGLNAVRAADPDVIVLDLMMPHTDGFDVLASLTPDGSRDAMPPVIVLTALSEASVKSRCYDAGATSVMTKPFDASALAIEVRRVAALRNADSSF